MKNKLLKRFRRKVRKDIYILETADSYEVIDRLTKYEKMTYPKCWLFRAISYCDESRRCHMLHLAPKYRKNHFRKRIIY